MDLVSQKTPLSVNALKDLLAAFKQKHLAEKTDLEEENRLLCEQINKLKKLEAPALEESKKHAEQLERVIQFLRERAEGAQLEIKQLTLECEDYKNKFKNADEQLKSAQTENGQLECEKRKKEEEIEILKRETPHSTFPYEEEIARIKQTLIRALRESQELQAHHQAVVAEKVALIGKWRQAQSLLEKERQQQNLLQEKLKQALALHNTLSTQIAEKETALAAQVVFNGEVADKQERLIKQREDSIFELQRQVGLLRHEGEKTRDELSTSYTTLKAWESDLYEAQQHLARKVKEMSELELQTEAKGKHVEELQRLLQEDKIRIAELEANCAMYTSQQNQLHEQLSKWENKYLALFEKCQNAENHVKELEKLEERYNQLQGIFSNMGNFLNGPTARHKEEEKASVPLKPEPQLPIKPEPQPEPKEKQPFSNLFDLPKPTTRPKHSFLE